MKVKISNNWLFPLRFILFFALAYIIWDFTAPVGTRLLSDIAGGIIMTADRTDYTKDITSTGKYIVVHYEPTTDGKPLTLEYKGFTFNSVLLVALIMAVPSVHYKIRLKILLLGLLILYPVQIFKFVIYVFNHYCQNMRRKSGAFIYPAYLHHSIGYIDKVMWRIDGQIIPVLIWGGLFYYYKWHKIFTKLQKSKIAEK